MASPSDEGRLVAGMEGIVRTRYHSKGSDLGLAIAYMSLYVLIRFSKTEKSLDLTRTVVLDRTYCFR